MKIEKTPLHNYLNTNSIKNLSLPGFFQWVGIFFFISILGSFVSCKEKDSTDLNILPDSDKLEVSYSSFNTLSSSIETEDSTRTDEPGITLLGSYIDPVFGKCEAGFISQFVLSNVNPDFYQDTLPGPVIDSIVLSLVYYNSYGDVSKLNGIQKVEVFELSKGINLDCTYYSNLKIADYFYESTLLGSKSFLPNLTAPVKVDSVNEVPQVRIKLDTAFFGKKLMGLPPFDLTNFGNNDLFKNYFKGLYVRANNGFQNTNQGGIMYFDLLHENSKITTYFHNGSLKRSFSYVVSNSECARVNLFKHNYSSAPLISSQLNNPALGQNQIYVQAMAGLRCKIEIPFLTQLVDSAPVSINKAEVVFHVDEPFIGKYVPVERLFLILIDSTGKKVFLPDQSESANFSGSYYGGYYDSGSKTYRFNIAKYVQQIATKLRTNSVLYLVPGLSYQTANRVVLKGGNNIEFNLTYTKL